MSASQFKNKVAIVTGAAIGIGFEIARQLADQGARVVLNDVDGPAAQQAVGKIQDAGGQCQAVIGDSSDLAVIDQMVQTAVEQFGQLDFVVANAGITIFASFLEHTLEDFQRLVGVNLQGTFFLAQKAVKQMIEQQSGGSMVLMASVTGHQVHPNLPAYSLSKAGIRMLAKSLGVELASHGIKVNAISPGATLTERTLSDPNYEAEWSALSPTGRPSTTADIAHATLFLLSSQSAQITGQTLVVDGGWSLISPPPKE